MKLKLGFRIWLLIVILIFSLMSIINFSGISTKGVLITSVTPNSTAFEQGLRQDQVITAIDGQNIESLEDFTNALQGKYTSNISTKTIFKTPDSEVILYTNKVPEITVSEISKTNIKMGLDLAGGARALVKAEDKKLSSEEVSDLVDITRNRLNEFGLTDLNVRPVSDLKGNHFMLIEIAGATPGDLEEMISKQGKFEAKIANETVFIGGERDIASVCRNDATCAVIESCQQSQDGNYYCNFRFSIYLSEAAAERHAEITKDLEVNSTSQGNYLTEKLDLYVDDKIIDSLLIGEGLKGRVTTQISISGSGSGETQDLAYDEAQKSMHKLQTILITGSLPYKLEIAKLDTISPALGKDFVRFIIIAGIAALIAAALVVLVRYRKIKPSLMVILFSFSEVIIILGVASLIEWNLDLASIAGILATIGTGFDDQIVILDEAKQKTILSLKQRLKRAFTIIMGAYFTSVVSIIPLLWAGAGLFKGFAVTTIIGISIGVFITRPAFSEVVKRIGE